MIQLTEATAIGLLDAAPDAIVVTDVKGRIALVNESAERLFGYARAELIGQLIEVLVPDALRQSHASLRGGYALHPHSRPMGLGIELAARRKDGTEFPAEISLGAVSSDTGPLFVSAIRDITGRIEAERDRARIASQMEREHLEAQLNQSRRLESLGQLAGGVAHDFNNLLAVILNYANFVSDSLKDASLGTLPPDGFEAMRSEVAEIEHAAERAARLTRQLLAFARREVTRPEVLDLNAVIADIDELLQRTLGSQIHLVISPAPDLLRIEADRGQIEQILVNLAVNARDAMPSGGTLSFDTENVDVDQEYAERHPGVSPGPYVRLRVSDTGVGMSPEVLARAFEPFFTTKAQGEGTGLGLATVYGIVAQAGGQVHIYSEPGIGTTVMMLLPAVQAQPAPTAAMETPVPRRGGETILVVDDESAIRELVRRILEGRGFQVLVAQHGQEAVDLAHDHAGPIDLLLTDVIMPGMGGKEVADRVTAVRPGVRVAFMSGYAESVMTEQGRVDEGVEIIAKPFSQTALLERINEILSAP